MGCYLSVHEFPCESKHKSDKKLALLSPSVAKESYSGSCAAGRRGK
jgi:hypothetical protein